MEVAGFRRMRTISQMTFETFIQIMLQIRMLIFFKFQSSDSVEFGISIYTVLLSVSLAFGHIILEVIFLYLEAMATKTNFINYAIVCFNGRFGWVPF